MNIIINNQKDIKTSLHDKIKKQNIILKRINSNNEFLNTFESMQYNFPISWMAYKYQFEQKYSKNIISPLNVLSQKKFDIEFSWEQLQRGSFINNLVNTNFYIHPIAKNILNYSMIINNMNCYMYGWNDLLNLNDLFSNHIFNFLKTIEKIFELHDCSLPNINVLDIKMLNKYYWVIPFEYDYDKLKNLSRYRRRLEFENYMLKYFNNNRVKRLFRKIRKQCKDKDKKILMSQIEKSFNNDDYAICITSLITMLDGLTLQLLEPNSNYQHLSYKIINAMLDYINEFSYELYLKVNILNNFYVKLYANEKNLKKTNRRLLSRHINSHGVKYLNKKVEVLRLLNAIYFCQQIIEETNLQEQFTRAKNGKQFIRLPLKKLSK